MTSTSIFIIVGFVLFVSTMVGSPFLSKRSQGHEDAENTEWEQQKEMLFTQLSDLEYDYHMGKVSASDYEEAKAELTAKAAKYIDPDKLNLATIEQEVDEEIKRYLEQQFMATGREVQS